MPEDPIRKYSDANKEFTEAFARVQQLGAIISDVGRYLNSRPYRMMVSNTTGVGFPAEVARGGAEYTLNADNWPTARAIAEALADLHDKAKQAENAHTALSSTDKSLVSPPDVKR